MVLVSFVVTINFVVALFMSLNKRKNTQKAHGTALLRNEPINRLCDH